VSVLTTVAVAPPDPTTDTYLVVTSPDLFPDPNIDGPFEIAIYDGTQMPTDPTYSELCRVISRDPSGWKLERGIDGSGPRTIVVGDAVLLSTHGVQPRLDVPFAQILDADTSTVQLVNTAVDTTVYQWTVPANLLGTKGAIRVDIGAKFKNATGSSRNLSFKVAFGGTTMYLDQVGISTDAGGFRAIDIHFVLCSDGATNAQKLSGMYGMGNNTAPTTGYGALAGLSASYPFGGTGAKDTTADQILAVNFKNAIADPNLDFTKVLAYTSRVAY